MLCRRSSTLWIIFWSPPPFFSKYVDDHFIPSWTLEEHIKHLCLFFAVLQEKGITISPAKCAFATSSPKFLGHMVSADGIIPQPRHVSAIQEFPLPQDIKQFLSLVIFYQRFLPAIARTLKLLIDLLCGNPKSQAWSLELPWRL